MKYTPIAPFGRAISPLHLSVVKNTETLSLKKPVNKWELLRDLSKAKLSFGVTERDLTVLQTLLSFFPEDALDHTKEMIIFPSNKAICERLHGMPCSTMRRYLARLVNARLLTRRDSPNGKRYMRKHREERVAFGFDLSALYYRSEDIAREAETVREAEERIRRLREIVSLMRRDLASLAEFGAEMRPGLDQWDQFRDKAAHISKALRRKLSPEDLSSYQDELEVFLNQARDSIDGPETEDMGTYDAESEHHHHSSNKEYIDFEPAFENAEMVAGVIKDQPNTTKEVIENVVVRKVPRIPLHLVITACPALKTFYDGEIRHWHQLYDAASHIRPAMGITVSAWRNAQRFMGPEQASVVVAAILERFSDIRSPSAYLHALTTKAAAGIFSCGPMVMALIGKQSAT